MKNGTWHNVSQLPRQEQARYGQIKPKTAAHLLSKTDQASVDPDMSYAIRKYHFYSWWKGSAGVLFHDRDKLHRIVNQVRAHCGLEAYSWDQFDEGWQYRNVLAESYDTARDEMFNLCFGWW